MVLGVWWLVRWFPSGIDTGLLSGISKNLREHPWEQLTSILTVPQCVDHFARCVARGGAVVAGRSKASGDAVRTGGGCNPLRRLIRRRVFNVAGWQVRLFSGFRRARIV